MLNHVTGVVKKVVSAGNVNHAFPWSQPFSFIFSEPSERVMLTGRHWVRDVYCKKCDEKVGWMYEFAMEEQQRYKESRVILERALVKERDGFEDTPLEN